MITTTKSSQDTSATTKYDEKRTPSSKKTQNKTRNTTEPALPYDKHQKPVSPSGSHTCRLRNHIFFRTAVDNSMFTYMTLVQGYSSYVCISGFTISAYCSLSALSVWSFCLQTFANLRDPYVRRFHSRHSQP